jgi:hypothetical protein
LKAGEAGSGRSVLVGGMTFFASLHPAVEQRLVLGYIYPDTHGSLILRTCIYASGDVHSMVVVIVWDGPHVLSAPRAAIRQPPRD